jgi:RNA polymerase sigma factor (sigma-70 family)
MGIMPTVSDPLAEERLALSRCMGGDSEALGVLRNRYQPVLFNVLVARGARPIEAEDLLADLWGDCVDTSDERPSLLHKFSGKCPLQNWLITVATRRLIDLKRKRQPQPDAPAHDNESGTTFIQRVPAPASSPVESGLVELLRDALQRAFADCPAEALVMLRLVHLHRISQRELARMWGCHEATISRSLTQAMDAIKRETMRRIKERDPWLELTWEDLVQLCETQDIGFL